ncbi:MAG: hypothetical protein C5B48_04275 [Candidatus Rokuibacteriota bacterium]|nr:MAG: hypothetical protein C5B48_04275 [Candidatus Rokubacteria bacterium]
MKRIGQATFSAALAGVLGACLLVPAGAAAARKPITGRLDRAGVTVVAVAPNGAVAKTQARPGFRLVPPAPSATLQLRERGGAHLGPVVVEGRGRHVTLGVRAGARLGRIEVRRGYARVVRGLPPKAVDHRLRTRAWQGVPLGLGVLTLGTCPAIVCSANIGIGLSSSSEADVALIVSAAAALLALAALLWQLLGARRKRGRIEVEVRLGLPIYQQGGGSWAVFVEVLNHTDHPARWVSASLELSDGRRLYLMQPPPGGELPAVLQPHDTHQTWAPCHELERVGLDLSDRVVAIAKMDTGALLRSPRTRLVSRSARKRRGN